MANESIRAAFEAMWAHVVNALTGKADKGLSNVEESDFVQKAVESQAEAIYAATSSDGIAYTVTVPGVTELFAGLRIQVSLSRSSASTTPTLNVNGLGAKGIRQPLSMNNSATVGGALNTWLSSACPVFLTYTGSQWKVDFVRPSASYLYGQVPIANGGTGATTAEAALENLGAPSLEYMNQMMGDIESVLAAL